MMLMYPVILFLLIRVVAAKGLRRWELPLLHVFLTSHSLPFGTASSMATISWWGSPTRSRLTNKVRSCEQSEPRSEPIVGRARPPARGQAMKIAFWVSRAARPARSGVCRIRRRCGGDRGERVIERVIVPPLKRVSRASKALSAARR